MNSIPTEGSGKGDTPRRVDAKRYGAHYDEIDWGSTKLPRKRKRNRHPSLWVAWGRQRDEVGAQ